VQLVAAAAETAKEQPLRATQADQAGAAAAPSLDQMLAGLGHPAKDLLAAQLIRLAAILPVAVAAQVQLAEIVELVYPAQAAQGQLRQLPARL